MKVELLVVPDCPNQTAAEGLLRQALTDVGQRDLPATTTLVDSHEDARERGFVGSPAFVIDGRDPFAGPDAQPALACRMSRGMAGTPDLADLSRVLRDAGAAERR